MIKKDSLSEQFLKHLIKGVTKAIKKTPDFGKKEHFYSMSLEVTIDLFTFSEFSYSYSKRAIITAAYFFGATALLTTCS